MASPTEATPVTTRARRIQMIRSTRQVPTEKRADFTAAALAGLRRTAGRVLWIKRVAFFEASLESHHIDRKSQALGLHFEVPSASELLATHGSMLNANFQLSPETVMDRLSRGHVAALAIGAAGPVAMVWLAFEQQKVSEIDRALVLAPHEVLTYDEHTLPAWRGKGISPALNRFADAYAAQRGATRRITWRRVGNAPAMRVAEKLGHRVIAVATAVRLFGRWCPWVFGIDGLAPRLDLRRI